MMALEICEETFSGVKNPKGEVERGFRFWDVVCLVFAILCVVNILITTTFFLLLVFSWFDFRRLNCYRFARAPHPCCCSSLPTVHPKILALDFGHSGLAVLLLLFFIRSIQRALSFRKFVWGVCSLVLSFSHSFCLSRFPWTSVSPSRR